MLKKVLLIVTLGILLAAALASAGCASGNRLTDMMAKVPGDTESLRFVDIDGLRNDADMNALYGTWKTSVDTRLESHGINSGDVNVFAFGTGSGKRFTLLVGGFDLDGVRSKLDGLHYDKGEYKGVELWELQEGWGYESDSKVALMGNLIILGNEVGVKGCIKVIKEGDSSWLKRVDISDVVSQLPVGLYVDLEKSQLAGLFLGGFEAYGVSAEKRDSDTLGISGVAKFEDEDNAGNAKNAIEVTLDTIFKSVDVSQEGAFLTASAELDIDKAAFLFQGF